MNEVRKLLQDVHKEVSNTGEQGSNINEMEMLEVKNQMNQVRSRVESVTSRLTKGTKAVREGGSEEEYNIQTPRRQGRSQALGVKNSEINRFTKANMLDHPAETLASRAAWMG